MFIKRKIDSFLAKRMFSGKVVDEDATLSDIAMTVILPVAPGFARTITVSLNRHQKETLSRFHE